MGVVRGERLVDVVGRGMDGMRLLEVVVFIDRLVDKDFLEGRKVEGLECLVGLYVELVG